MVDKLVLEPAEKLKVIDKNNLDRFKKLICRDTFKRANNLRLTVIADNSKE